MASAVALLVVLLSCLRFTHVHLLWADEDYHLAAAINVLHGKVPYRDFWYDKPPLTALYYLLIGGWYGWPLRLLDAGYIVGCCWVLYCLAANLWSKAEGLVAALLLAFCTTFYLPSAVIPFAADAAMLLTHLLAVYFAVRQRPILAGCCAGAAFLANTKAIFVLLSCYLFLIAGAASLRAIVQVTGAFLMVGGAGLGVLGALGAWPGYVEQVWRWGLIYASESPVVHPFLNGIQRTAHWLGFHLAAAAGGLYFFLQARDRVGWKLAGWLLFSFAGVALGGRFAPHYFLQLLPALLVTASRGLTLAHIRHRLPTIAIVTILVAVPLIRFGSRYAALIKDAQGHHWADAAMDVDSKAVADRINGSSRREDTLFVWGYRPDIYVYTRLVSDSLFWDSQPLTGVPADRHLFASAPIYGRPAQQNRAELVRSHPVWVVDGLGLLNPRLRLDSYADLSSWLSQYELVAKTPLSLIYRRRR